jgi:hypothetical protein
LIACIGRGCARGLMRACVRHCSAPRPWPFRVQ